LRTHFRQEIGSIGHDYPPGRNRVRSVQIRPPTLSNNLRVA
jgi:hypothetical protein